MKAIANLELRSCNVNTLNCMQNRLYVIVAVLEGGKK